MAAAAGDDGLLELARRALGAALLALAACRGGRPGAPAGRIPGEDGPHITVEVLNASGRQGLARVATRALRQAGIDVVSFGTAPASIGTLDSTRIIIRREAPAAGQRVRGALHVGRVSSALDSARLLDVTVLLGADFQPGPELHP